MNELQKHLTIKEAKYEIKRYGDQRDLHLTKKEINKLKVQPKAIQIKDIVVDSSHTNLDNYLNNVIKDEEHNFVLHFEEKLVNYKFQK